MTYLLLTGFLAAGFLVGRLFRLPERVQKWAGGALSVCLFGIVFLLGLKLGGDRTLAGQAGSIGLQALALAAGAVFGSVLLAWLYALLRGRGRQS